MTERDTSQLMLLDFALTLLRIGAFDDTGANEKLERTGSYSRFDEPSAVQAAREALARWKDQEHLWKQRGDR